MDIWTIWSVAAGVWLMLLVLQELNFKKNIRFLRDQEWLPERTNWPKVSLIVPACDEGSTIAAAARSLLDMDYPNLELILIDDRSTDDTGRVITKLAREDSRIRAVSISALPPGWLGKVHALHQGVLAAQGEWLLFSDADVHYQKHSLKKAIAHCETKPLDFLAVVPSIIGGTFALKVMVAQFVHGATLPLNFKRLEDPRFRDCAGAGAFNLVRREAYQRSRGWEWLRMDVVDDFGLGLLLKESGARLGILSGLNEIELEWYPHLRAFVNGMEKNSFAVFQYSLSLVRVACAVIFAIFIGFTAAPLLATNVYATIFVWGALALFLLSSARAIRTLVPTHPGVVIFFPITFLLLPLIFLRAALLCLARGGVHWRGTFYPLTDLRREQRFKTLHFITRRRRV